MEHNILIAFILNLVFSLFELIGGFITNSISIMSDSIHDLGDAISIGTSYFLERKSKDKPNRFYTYGYLRFSVLGAFITSTILLVGSIIVIIKAVTRIINPVSVNYEGMFIFSIIGIIVNVIASIITSHGKSLNQKAVRLHMLEDVLGWVIVFIGSIAMKFTNIMYIDPILSIIVTVLILKGVIENLKEIMNIFLVKVPDDVKISKIKKDILKVDGVEDIHHIHVWSMDGINNYATLHIKTKSYSKQIKEEVKEQLKEKGINHSTIEFEEDGEDCLEDTCKIEINHKDNHHHH